MQFDSEKAKELLGKYILVGITYLDKDGKLESMQQLHGIIQSTDEQAGILIDLCGTREGEQWNMPPDTSGITKADPGVYSLRETGETVENPDYVCTWEVHRAEQET